MMRPGLGGVLETALYVDDLERSKQFYQRLFAFDDIGSDPFDKLRASHRLCALSVEGKQVLLLIKRGSSVEPHQSKGGLVPGSDSSGTSHLTFSIPAAELEAWENWLAENAVPVESKVRWEAGGTSLYFRDPDGPLLELATPGLWSIY